MFMSHYATEVCKCPNMDHRLRKLDDGFHQIYSHTFAGRKGNVDGGLYLQQEQLQASAVPQA